MDPEEELKRVKIIVTVGDKEITFVDIDPKYPITQRRDVVDRALAICSRRIMEWGARQPSFDAIKDDTTDETA